MGLVSSGLQATGSLLNGFSQASSYKAQAKISQANAVASNSQANASVDLGYLNAQRDYQEGAQKLGSQRAQMAANGVVLNSGSALDVQDATGRNTGLTVGSDLYDANVKAVGYRNQTTSYNNEARADRAQARNAIAGGAINASLQVAQGIVDAASGQPNTSGPSLISGSSFSSQWNDMFKSGSGGAALDGIEGSGQSYDSAGVFG